MGIVVYKADHHVVHDHVITWRKSNQLQILSSTGRRCRVDWGREGRVNQSATPSPQDVSRLNSFSEGQNTTIGSPFFLHSFNLHYPPGTFDYTGIVDHFSFTYHDNTTAERASLQYPVFSHM